MMWTYLPKMKIVISHISKYLNNTQALPWHNIYHSCPSLSFFVLQKNRSVMRLSLLQHTSCSTWSISKRLPIVHHEDYVCYLPPNHRFPMPKFTKIYKCLLKDGIIDEKQVAKPQKVSEETVHTVHTEEYISKFFNGTTSDKEQRITGFKWSSGLVKRCRYETGNVSIFINIKRLLSASE